MKKTHILIAVAIATLIAGCGPSQPVYQQPAVYAQPQVVQQAPLATSPVIVQERDSGAGALLTGMALGHMMSGGGGARGGDNHTNVQKTTVVNKTTIVQQAAPAPAPTRAASFSGRSYSSMRASSGLSSSKASFSSSRSSFSSRRR